MTNGQRHVSIDEMLSMNGWHHALSCLAGLCLLASACADRTLGGDGSAADNETGGDTGNGPDLQDHGTVMLELHKADPSEDTFADTTYIQVQLNYQDCLQDFYESKHPEWAQSASSGGPLFELFTDVLCDPALVGADIHACDVQNYGITQNLGAAGGMTWLRVTYRVDDTDLDEAIFHVGPLPHASLTGALTGGCTPTVELGSRGLNAGYVVGYNSNYEAIWATETTGTVSTAATGQQAPLRVNVNATQGAP